ncbi:MAG TPA: hypothetical protein VFI19_06500 [Nocardioides sp.]|nr:hypothetical protein [Nocardioides sp.]
MDEQRWLTFDLFEGRVGEKFVVSGDGDAPVPMELAEAKESTEPGGIGPQGQERRQFSLVFRGPLERVLPQAIYGLDHDALGHLDLFLVPIGPAEGAMRYHAAFA